MQGGGEVKIIGGDFVYKKKDDKVIPISLTADGTRKIGLLYQLVLNREITPGTVLFIDEPENSLHPSLLMKLLEALVRLSKHGVQIFMATHNYFVLKQLEIIARRDDYPIRCFSLKLDENDTAYIDDESTMGKDSLMPMNAILDASMNLLNQHMDL